MHGNVEFKKARNFDETSLCVSVFYDSTTTLTIWLKKHNGRTSLKKLTI